MKVSVKAVLSIGKPQKVLEYIKHNSNQENIYFFGISFNTDINDLTLAKEVRRRLYFSPTKMQAHIST
jgi:hypothetical protein